MAEPITVAVVDDHTILLAGVCMLLAAEKDMSVVGRASGNPFETYAMVEDTRPRVLLLDIAMPGEGGIALIPEIRRLSPDTRILMLTMYEDRHYLQSALAAGAAGYVLKKGLDVDLLYAIRAVARGEMYIQPAMVREMLEGSGKNGGAAAADSKEEMLWDTLSPREREVMSLVAHGHTSRQIGEKSGLSEKTVATYRSRSMAKLGISGRAELIELTLRLGILDKGQGED